jgi:hypothetical protein
MAFGHLDIWTSPIPTCGGNACPVLRMLPFDRLASTVKAGGTRNGLGRCRLTEMSTVRTAPQLFLKTPSKWLSMEGLARLGRGHISRSREAEVSRLPAEQSTCNSPLREQAQG